MIPNSKVNLFERLFDNCYECRFVDKSSVETIYGAIFGGNAQIANDFTGKQTKVLLLDGTGDFVNFGNTLDIATQDFSIDFVIKTTDEAGVICGKRNGEGNGWIVKTTTGPKVLFEVDDGTEASGAQTTSLTNAYHHVAIVADRSGNATFYLDGASDGTLDISGSSGTLTNSTSFYVGVDGDGSSSPLSAYIPYVRVWRNKLLTANEVNQLAATEGFGSGTPLFGYAKRGLVSYWPLGNIQGTTVNDIVGSNNGTATSMSEANLVDGYNQYRSALDFDGSSDSIIATAQDFGSGGTINSWVNVGVSSGDDLIVQNYNGERFGIGISGTSIRGAYHDGTFYKKSGVIALNQWCHVVLTYDGVTTVQLYIDGIAQTGTLAPVNTGSAAHRFVVGANSNVGAHYNGKVQDVVTFNRELTALEVEILYKHQRRGLRI
jgi:hypothetical protein